MSLTMPPTATVAEVITDSAAESYRLWSAHQLDQLVGTAGQCVGEPMSSGRDEWYVSGQPGQERGETARTAREVCRGCPITAACLERTLRWEARSQECWGIAGATAPRQRRRLLRQRGWKK